MGGPGGGEVHAALTSTPQSRLLLASGTHGREPGGEGGEAYHDLNPNPEMLWGSQKACGSAVSEGGCLELSGPCNSNTDSKRIHVTVPSSWRREDLGRL